MFFSRSKHENFIIKLWMQICTQWRQNWALFIFDRRIDCYTLIYLFVLFVCLSVHRSKLIFINSIKYNRLSNPSSHTFHTNHKNIYCLCKLRVKKIVTETVPIFRISQEPWCANIFFSFLLVGSPIAIEHSSQQKIVQFSSQKCLCPLSRPALHRVDDAKRANESERNL